MQSIITQIGPKAFSEEAILIFFDETATELLKEYTIIQEFQDEDFLLLSKGDKIAFGKSLYTIEKVGSKVIDQLKEIGHVSFFFGEAPEEDLINAITLKESKLPKLEVGTLVTYKAGE